MAVIIKTGSYWGGASGSTTPEGKRNPDRRRSLMKGRTIKEIRNRVAKRLEGEWSGTPFMDLTFHTSHYGKYAKTFDPNSYGVYLGSHSGHPTILPAGTKPSFYRGQYGLWVEYRQIIKWERLEILKAAIAPFQDQLLMGKSPKIIHLIDDAGPIRRDLLRYGIDSGDSYGCYGTSHKYTEIWMKGAGRA